MPPESNKHLRPLPTVQEILVAIAEHEAEGHYGIRCVKLAERLDVEPARRLGRGAVAGSGSGSCSPSIRLAPRLGSMARAELLRVFWVPNGYSTRSTDRHYALTDKGREALRDG